MRLLLVLLLYIVVGCFIHICPLLPRSEFVVVDTPPGPTLLLLDAAGS